MFANKRCREPVIRQVKIFMGFTTELDFVDENFISDDFDMISKFVDQFRLLHNALILGCI